MAMINPLKDQSAVRSPDESAATAHRHYQEFAARFPTTLTKKEEKAAQRFRSHPGSSVTKLRDILSLTDDLMEATYAFIACSKTGKGCEACCHYPHVSFDRDAYWCDPVRMTQVKMPHLRFSELERAFDENRVDMPVVDIRHVFGNFDRNAQK